MAAELNVFLHSMLKKKVLKTRFNLKMECHTLAKTEIIYPKNVRAKVAMDFT